MKYNNIFNLVPEDEKESYTEETASEGVWLSHKHLEAINSQLQTLSNNADRSEEEIQTLTTQLETAKNEISNNTEKIKTQETLISSLKKENDALGNKPSGSGTVLESTEDHLPKRKTKMTLNDDEHPFNASVDEYLSTFQKTTEHKNLK